MRLGIEKNNPAVPIQLKRRLTLFIDHLENLSIVLVIGLKKRDRAAVRVFDVIETAHAAVKIRDRNNVAGRPVTARGDAVRKGAVCFLHAFKTAGCSIKVIFDREGVGDLVDPGFSGRSVALIGNGGSKPLGLAFQLSG